MDAEQAVAAIGANQPRFAVRNMAKALRICRRLNTPEEERRCAAAEWALRNWPAYIEAARKRRER